MYDYEFTETSIFNRFSTRVLVPDGIPDDVLDGIGLPANRRLKYPGIKEEIYVNKLRLTGDDAEKLRRQLDLSDGDERILAVFRPPATTANYHEEKGTELFREVLKYFLAAENVYTVVVPRTNDQAAELDKIIKDSSVPADRFKILTEAVDGMKLVAVADLLISGGGTMNREAALLGVPVYSIFAGRQGALDAQMEKDGRIAFIREPNELGKLQIKKREHGLPVSEASGLTDRVERFVIEQICSFLAPNQ